MSPDQIRAYGREARGLVLISPLAAELMQQDPDVVMRELLSRG